MSIIIPAMSCSSNVEAKSFYCRVLNILFLSSEIVLNQYRLSSRRNRNLNEGKYNSIYYRYVGTLFLKLWLKLVLTSSQLVF